MREVQIAGMDSELRSAYYNTTYVVHAPDGDINIRIGSLNELLDRLLQEHHSQSWAFITAWNPRSSQLSIDENDQRQHQLKKMLGEHNFITFAGHGVGDSGNWPPEESFLALGIDQETAIRIGRMFEQNAIVFGERGKAILFECFP